jgi:hypothetical protein
MLSIVLGRGFLGLINRIKAREVLTLDSSKCILLLRFSRTAPEYLAISFKDESGNIGHRINNTGMPIRVRFFFFFLFLIFL